MNKLPNFNFGDLIPHLYEVILLVVLAVVNTIQLYFDLREIFTNTWTYVTLYVVLLLIQGIAWVFITRTMLLVIVRTIATSTLTSDFLPKIIQTAVIIIVQFLVAGTIAWLMPSILHLPSWMNASSFTAILIRFEIVLVLINLIPWILHFAGPNKFNLLEEKPL